MGTFIIAVIVLIALKFIYSLIFEQDKYDKNGKYRN